MADLVSRPTAEQVLRFRSLTMSERYAWLTNMMQTTHRLATEATRAKWRAHKLVHGGGFVAGVATLVAALDRADFDATEAALSPDAVYAKDGETIFGRAAIVASYRASHERAIATLTSIVYRSSLEAIAPGTVRVSFEDLIEVAGHSHRFRCEQDMSVGRSKLVEHIVHRELEGERAALDAFLGNARGSR